MVNSPSTDYLAPDYDLLNTFSRYLSPDLSPAIALNEAISQVAAPPSQFHFGTTSLAISSGQGFSFGDVNMDGPAPACNADHRVGVAEHKKASYRLAPTNAQKLYVTSLRSCRRRLTSDAVISKRPELVGMKSNLLVQKKSTRSAC